MAGTEDCSSYCIPVQFAPVQYNEVAVIVRVDDFSSDKPVFPGRSKIQLRLQLSLSYQYRVWC